MATVLVVDDEPLMCSMLTQVLQQEGFSVLTAACGTQALALFRSHRHEIDLLISDIVMPEMDGPSLAAKLRAECPDIPVLLMSGYCESYQLRNDFEFLPKPFSIADLLSRVRVLMQHIPAAAA
jgi:two-component system, cell cycle sensor histidine kinase and response regulator CckA